MKLSKPSKILVLVATFAPPVYMIAFFASFFLSFGKPGNASPIFDNFGLFMAIHLCVMLLTFALLAFYIVFLFKTERVKPEQKVLWAVVLFFGGPIAMPIFWFVHVWPSTHESSNETIGGA